MPIISNGSVSGVSHFVFSDNGFGVLPLMAHAGHSHGDGGMLTGFLHPLMGLDHLLAMIAVGIWACLLGGRAIWVVPVSFLTAMAVGGLVSFMGGQLAFVEQGIAGSVFLLGLFIALVTRMPVVGAAMVVGLFAVFHGFAHGAEMPAGSSGWLYGFGFLAATALLHAAGIFGGMLIARYTPARTMQWAGAALAVSGLLILTGML